MLNTNKPRKRNGSKMCRNYYSQNFGVLSQNTNSLKLCSVSLLRNPKVVLFMCDRSKYKNTEKYKKTDVRYIDN